MIDGYSRTAIRQTRELMVVLGYFMAYAAFFVVLAENGAAGRDMVILQYGLLVVPLIYVFAVAIKSINQARASD